MKSKLTDLAYYLMAKLLQRPDIYPIKFYRKNRRMKNRYVIV